MAIPTTADTCGRLIAYTWGELSSKTWGTIHTMPYSVRLSFTATLNASNSVFNFATQLNDTLEKSNMFQLSEVETIFGIIEQLTDQLNRQLG